MIREEYPTIVLVQSLESIRTAGGGYREEWTDFDIVKCQIAPITDDKRIEALNEVNNLLYEFFIPYQAYQALIGELGLTANQELSEHARIIYGDQVLYFRGHGKNLGGNNEIMEFVLRKQVLK